MKKAVLILIYILSINIASSQLFTKEKLSNNENFDKAKISWGYYLGVNSYDFNFDYQQDLSDVQVEKTTGFNVGLIANLRINDFFDLRFDYQVSNKT